MEAPTDDVLSRTLTTADLEIRGDGRTVYGLAVPFDHEEEVNDGFGAYREVFRFGAFARTINSGVERVKFYVNHSHRERKLPIGRAHSLTEDKAGLVGEFRVSNTRDGDEALELVRDGVLDSFSVGFAPVPDKSRQKGSLVERLEVKLREVSVVAFPAYEGALIAGVRSDLPDGWTVDELVELARTHDLRTLLAGPAPEGTPPADPQTQEDDPPEGTRRHINRSALRFELEEFVAAMRP